MQPLIDAETLAGNLSNADWVVVDCRFQLNDPEAGFAAYGHGHIPGARYAHLDDDLAREPSPHEGRHPLPNPDDFAATLASWGIDNATQVVAYDDASGAIAARLWWLLRWLGHERVTVLDGGLQAWLDSGGPMETEEPEITPAEFRASEVRDDRVVVTGDIPLEIAAGALLLDARSAERFRGEQEPIDPVAGHVPDARNLPFTELVAPDSRFLPERELRERLQVALDGRDASTVITMCGSGVTACHLALGFAAAGLPEGRLYAGSWSEWIRDDGREVALGDD